MNTLRAIRAVVILCCASALLAAGLALGSATEAQAKPCCWVMVCDANACYHKCVVCPTFP